MSTNHKRFILEKMIRHDWIGAKHTNIQNIPKGKPRHEHKEIMKTLKELDKYGFFIKKPKSDGLHISLNPHMLPKIRELLEKE